MGPGEAASAFLRESLGRHPAARARGPSGAGARLDQAERIRGLASRHRPAGSARGRGLVLAEGQSAASPRNRGRRLRAAS